MNRKINLEAYEKENVCPYCGGHLLTHVEKNIKTITCASYPACDFRRVVRISTILVEDTDTMDRQRRLMEQDGHRRFARVNAREHQEREEMRQQLLQGELESSILQHPALNNQRFDGVDNNINPEPALNTEARREFDNERREQEKEKQLRLGNMPQFSSAPKPQWP